MYTLFQTGPDNRSTYPECWGSTSTSPGRQLAVSSTLAGLIDAVSAIEHDNFWVRGPGGKNVAGSRKDFFALPSVAKCLAEKE